MEKAQVQLINWNKVSWQQYAKMIKNQSFSMAEQNAKLIFEKYSEILVDKTNGNVLFGKSRIIDSWLASDIIRAYEE